MAILWCACPNLRFSKYASQQSIALALKDEFRLGRENDEAMQHCEKSLNMHSEQPTALMLLALLLTARGEHKDALDIVLDALDEFPNHYGLLVLRLKLEVGFSKFFNRFKCLLLD